MCFRLPSQLELNFNMNILYLLQFPQLVLSELKMQHLATLCNLQVYVLLRKAKLYNGIVNFHMG